MPQQAAADESGDRSPHSIACDGEQTVLMRNGQELQRTSLYAMNITISCKVKAVLKSAFLVALLAAAVSAQTPLVRSRRVTASDDTKAAALVPNQTTTSTSVPNSGPLPTPVNVSARPPRPANAWESLRNAKVIFVRSHSVLVGQSVIESKLRKRQEFQQFGMIITRDPDAADLILEVKHDILTKYVFTAIDPWTNIVVASGKLSSLGGTVAGKVAKRFMKQVMKARTQPGP